MNDPQTLLMIEDDLAFRQNLATFLEDSGYQVLEAGNGQEGLEQIHCEKPDLVLTDLRMPVMDGLEFIIRMKTAAPNIPIIVVSGTGDERTKTATLDHGVVAYIQKPVEDMEQVEKIIERTLASMRKNIHP